MTRRKRAASENEDLPEVQKRSKTRAQTRRVAEEEGLNVMGTARGIFRVYSVPLSDTNQHSKAPRAAKQKAIQEAGKFTSVRVHLLYSLYTQRGWPINGRMGRHPRSRPRRIQS